MKPVFIHQVIVAFRKNTWLGMYLFLFLIFNFCSEYHIPKINTKAGDNLTSDLQNTTSDIFMIRDPDNGALNNRQKGIATVAQARATATPEYIVSFSDRGGIYGEQSVNVPLGLISYQTLYKYPSPEVDSYAVISTPGMVLKIKDSETPKPSYYTIVKHTNNNVSVRFIFIDTPSLVDENNSMPNKKEVKTVNNSQIQLNWLKGVLKNATEKWIFVVGHHPLFMKGSDNPELIEKIEPILKQYKVDFYLSSSNGSFEYSQPKRSSVEYIASGSARALGKKGDIGKNDNAIFSSSVPGFTLVTINKNLLEIFFVTDEGKVLYSVKRKNQHQTD